MDRLRDLADFLDRFFKFLFVVIAFRATAIGEEFSTKHPHFMMVLVLMIMFYFLLWLLQIVLQNNIERLQDILFWIMLVIGGVSSVLVLTIINLVTASLALLSWVAIFAVTAYQSYRPADARTPEARPAV